MKNGASSCARRSSRAQVSLAIQCVGCNSSGRRVRQAWPSSPSAQPRRGNRVGSTDQPVGIRHLLAQPAPPVAMLLVGMPDGQCHLLETVVGQLELESGIVLPAFPDFLAIPARIRPQGIVWKRVPFAGQAVGTTVMFCRCALPTSAVR